MITVSLITTELRGINGANRVTEKLIMGGPIFLKNNIELQKIYTDEGSVLSSQYISHLGDYSREYLDERERIEKLKKSRLYRTYPVQAARQYAAIRKSEPSVKHYLGDDEHGVDCVIFQDVFCAFYYLRLVKKPKRHEKLVFITHTDTDPLEQYLINRPEIKGTYTEKRIRQIYKQVFETVDLVVTICSSAMNYISTHYSANVCCILNGIEDISFSNDNKKSSNKSNIVILGSVTRRKGHDFICEALKKLSDHERDKFELHIIGKGDYLSVLQKQIEDNSFNNCCIFHGEVKDVTSLLVKMDAMLLPSRAEAVPISIIEGLRCGLPVFSTNVGEIPEMISSCGEIIDISSDGVVEAIRTIIDNPDILKEYSLNARKKFLKEFTLESMINKYANEINHLFNR